MPGLHKSLALITFSLLFIWIILSIVHSLFNLTKLYSEEPHWLSMSLEQKRTELFGDSYSIAKFINATVPSSANIIFLAPGGKVYYQVRYFIYPRKMYWAKDNSEVNNYKRMYKDAYLLVLQTKNQDLIEYSTSGWTLPAGSPSATLKLAPDISSVALLYSP
jgi:hypothetical protein